MNFGSFLLTCASIYLFNKNKQNLTGGIDWRHTANSDLDKEALKNISINIEKMRLLKYLENQNISLVDKMKIIERTHTEIFEKKYTPNFLAGGLFNDWLFDI
jgi:hypothetical protein